MPYALVKHFTQLFENHLKTGHKNISQSGTSVYSANQGPAFIQPHEGFRISHETRQNFIQLSGSLLISQAACDLGPCKRKHPD